MAQWSAAKKIRGKYIATLVGLLASEITKRISFFPIEGELFPKMTTVFPFILLTEA